MRPSGRRLVAAIAGVVIVAVVGCGGRSRSRTATSGARRTAVGEASTADGHYVVTLAVGGTPSAAERATCWSPPADGRARVPVTLTVRTADTSADLPLPPLRVELVAGDRREPVPVAPPGGTCSFTPQVPGVGPGAGVTFVGSTPEIDGRAAPGTAGRVEVGISENTFSLVLPVP